MTAPRRLLPALLALACLAALPAAASGKTVWLCKPGLEDDACTPSLDTTRFSPTGERLGTQRIRRARPRRIDCFYVYPTVSDQPTTNASRRIDPELRSIALYQAARFSRDCRVYAPVYRQITLAGLAAPTEAAGERAYADVRAAWRAYLERAPRRRGVVLIGHSQGALWLTRLIREEFDPVPRLRRRLVSAILLGGNVTVRKGQDAGGDFEHVPACTTARRLGCVVAYSTFNAPVPADSRFGRASDPELEVLCVNPATLAGGEGTLDPIVPRAPFAPGTAIGNAVAALGFTLPGASTPWVEFPDSYSARCSSADGANVLRVTPLGGAQALTPLGPDGLHLVDVNVALGNLTRLVRRQAAAYTR